MTLNKVVNRLKVLALNHKQINDFRFGDRVEWLSNGDLKYPACLVDLDTATINKDLHTNSFPFEIMLADLVNVNDDARLNELDALSDLTQVMQDLIALINDPEFDDDWTIESTYQIQYYKTELDDEAVAIKMTITISTDYRNDRCQIPLRSDDDGVYLDTGNGILATDEGKLLDIS